MRRKAGAGRPPPEIGRLTAAKAVRGAVAQAAQDVAALVAVAGTVEEARTTLARFVSDVPDPALLALVEGPAGRFGLVVLDPQVVAALIEVQTTGRVVPHAADARAPTRTDAIMCADFIDRLLELVDERVTEAGLDIAPALRGFRYAIALAEPRAISMTLEDTPYRLFACEVDLGRGAKTGALRLLLPYDPPGQKPNAGAETGAFTDAIRAQVYEVEARLNATLLRRKLALSDVMAFDVGTLIPVPHAALARIAVEALDGTIVARGRLGQVQGHRAVRLTEDLGVEDPGGMTDVSGPAAKPRALPGTPPNLPAPNKGGDIGDLGDLTDLGDIGGIGDPGDLGGLGGDDPDGLPDLAALGDLGELSDLPQ